MSIPKDLTCTEVGILLKVVGRNMIIHDVCAEAVLDFNNCGPGYDEGVIRIMCAEGLTTERAKELLQMTLEEAINFNHAEH